MQNILQSQELSATENALAVEALRNNPILYRYFQLLAHNIAIELAYCPVFYEEDPAVYERKRLVLRGQLDLLDTLGSAYTTAASTTITE